MARPSPDSILLLSSDHRLIAGVRRLNAPMNVRSLPCLRALPSLTRHHRIILDPRQFSQCCLEGVVRLGRRFGRATLRTLSHPSLQAPLFEITENRPVHTTRPGGASQPRRSSSDWKKPRQAWRTREAIFDAPGCDGVVRDFLELALAHSLEPYSVAQAAADLNSCPRQLDRHCLRSLDYSPGLLIDLARTMSVAEDLVDTEWQLDVIAFKHGYHDAATMSRQFLRFTGERPGSYREQNRPSPRIRQRVNMNCH